MIPERVIAGFRVLSSRTTAQLANQGLRVGKIIDRLVRPLRTALVKTPAKSL